MNQILGKNGRQTVCVWIILFATLTLHARTVSVPKLSEPTFLDTEISTNVAITAWTEHTRSFKIVLSLDATPSNNVQVAFGVDEDADRLLSEEETKLTLGWDCGEWFVASAEHTNRFTATPSENTAYGAKSASLYTLSQTIPRIVSILSITVFQLHLQGWMTHLHPNGFFLKHGMC